MNKTRIERAAREIFNAIAQDDERVEIYLGDEMLIEMLRDRGFPEWEINQYMKSLVYEEEEGACHVK